MGLNGAFAIYFEVSSIYFTVIKNLDSKTKRKKNILSITTSLSLHLMDEGDFVLNQPVVFEMTFN